MKSLEEVLKKCFEAKGVLRADIRAIKDMHDAVKIRLRIVKSDSNQFSFMI